MRTITLIIIHCSAVGPSQTSSAAQINLWHKAQGWKGIGYHYVVRRDGTIEKGRAEEEIGAHCKNHNRYSIGICYEGGIDARGQPSDTRTAEQKVAILELLKRMKKKYPRAIIVGHNTLDKSKACPCFDAVKEYREV